MDPLALLRQYAVNDRIDQVAIVGDRIQFGDQYDFPKDITTAYRSQQGQGDFYDLETLLIFLRNKAVRHSQYLLSTKQSGVQAVTFQDRKLLLDYLTGQVETSSNVQFTDEVYRALARKRNLTQAGVDGSAPPAKFARPDGEAPGAGKEVSASAASRERVLRNRNTQLCLPNKDLTAVLAIAQKSLAAVEKESKKLEASAHHRAKHSSQPASKPQIENKSSGRFHRQPAPAPKEIKELGIDVYGTKAPTEPAPLPDTSSSKAPASKPPKLWKHERNGTYLDHKGRPCDSSGRLLDPGRRSSRPPSSNSRHPPSGKTPALKTENIPIIIVPEGLSALINMYNAKQFLEKGEFVTSQDARAANPEKKDVIGIERPNPDPKGRPIRFHVTDRVPSEKSPEWRRVACVICQGKNWQFKNFPFKGAKDGNLVDTFQSVCGIFFHYKDESVPETVRTWNVKVLPLPRAFRNNDITLVQEMFAHLRKFLDNKSKSNVKTGCIAKMLQYGSTAK